MEKTKKALTAAVFLFFLAGCGAPAASTPAGTTQVTTPSAATSQATTPPAASFTTSTPPAATGPQISTTTPIPTTAFTTSAPRTSSTTTPATTPTTPPPTTSTPPASSPPVPTLTFALIPHKPGEAPLLPHPVAKYEDCVSCHFFPNTGTRTIINEQHACDLCHDKMQSWQHGMPVGTACSLCHFEP